MVSLLASALVNTLVDYMFNQAMNKMDSVHIDNAPSWYMQKVDDDMCSFASSRGGIGLIEDTKNNASYQMYKDINGLINITVYENIKTVTTDKEQRLVEQWKSDPNLDTFIQKNIDFNKIKYEDELDTTFVRACIPKKTIINYQKDRLKNINKSLLNHKADSAMNELDEMLKK